MVRSQVGGELRWAAAACGALVLCLGAALAAGGLDDTDPEAFFGHGVLGTVVASALVIATGLALVVLVFAARMRSTAHGGGRRTGSVLAFLLLIVGAVFVLLLLLGGDPPRDTGPSTVATTTEIAPSGPGRDESAVDWLVVVGVTAACLAGFVVILRRLGPRPGPALAGPLHPQLVVRAAELSMAAMLDEPDHRRAVILAYQQMEQALARSGMPRAAWEGPSEFLRRVLAGAGVDAAPVAELTELFVQAKFSSRPVGSGMRAAALDALERIRAGAAVGAET
jgi:hypothetical protein